MRLQTAIKSIFSAPGKWVKVEVVQSTPSGLQLSLAIHEGRRGRRVAGWIVFCRGVREVKITDFDGGGLALYAASHPAARQYGGRKARLWTHRSRPEEDVVGVLCRAHMGAVDDWIEVERYLPFGIRWTPTGRPFLPERLDVRGPEFLLREYAKALRAIGEHVQLTTAATGSKPARPQVLHLGSSYVVADAFDAQRSPER